MILQWGRISKITFVPPDSGSMTAANVCGTLKYNILKERDCVFCQHDSWNTIFISKISMNEKQKRTKTNL